ncbi:GtrA family protein [Glutamicibacter creatinolyticus]|uniref:GtrA family protein n=1 Tax=Glutamicibacter TaxID=1742989 RepID=UPI0010FEF936|nr:GtrA family protein [Glutamicibacter sp. V16R2B1]TLK48301.1 GtrA family protein [Glutamicibacter sp. V16R2B1]
MGNPNEEVAAPTPDFGTRQKMRQRLRIVYFLGVGGVCFILTLVVNYGLKLTILTAHPTTAFLIANAVSTVASYFLSRRFTFGDIAHGLKRVQFIKFVVMSVLAVGITSAPVYISRWVFGLTQPHVTLLVQEVADFVAGPIIGTLLGMVFRWWAMKKFVFLDREHQRTEITAN